jgi:uncharacterized protein with NRDE domain
MCTVIYYPAKEGALLSSCRDEDPGRATASLPGLYMNGDIISVYSKDGAAGGTWAGMNDEGNVIILLNGAFENHTREKQYWKSRGLIVKELLFAADPVKEWEQYDLESIEPFTLVIWSQKKLYEAVWDGRQKYLQLKDAGKPNIWSSSTLYDDAAKKIRLQWFAAGVEKKAFSDAGSLRSFLLAHKESDHGFVMNRNARLATLSIACFTVQDKWVSMHYHDLIKKEEEEINLFIKANIAQ